MIDVPPTGINPVNVIMVMNSWSDKNTLVRKGTEISISYFNINSQMMLQSFWMIFQLLDVWLSNVHNYTHTHMIIVLFLLG